MHFEIDKLCSPFGEEPVFISFHENELMANPIYEQKTAGRFCLVGEHSDWAGEYGYHDGHAIVGPTTGLYTFMKAGLHQNNDGIFSYESSVVHGNPLNLQFNRDEFIKLHASIWFFFKLSCWSFISDLIGSITKQIPGCNIAAS